MSDPYTPAQWRQILANAHAALAADPTNARARAALKAAVTAVSAENAVTSRQEAAAAQAPEPGTAAATIVGAGQGASLGLASKLGDLLPGPSNTAYLQAARSAHPIASTLGDIGGTTALSYLLSRTPVLAGVGPTAQGVITGGLTGAGRGAVEAPAGNRGTGAVIGGILGGGLGYVGGKVAGKVAPTIGKIIGNLRGTPAAAPAMAPEVATALESRIAQPIGGPLEDIAAAHADLAAGKITPQDFQTAMEMASRRVNATPHGLLSPAPAPAAAPSEGLLPWYPRGGSVQQATAPLPVSNPPVIGPASPETIVKTTPTMQLLQTLDQPGTLARVRQAILGELQRRGIVGQGLLAPAAR